MQRGDLWVPLGLNAATLSDRTGTHFHILAGRMRTGVTVDRVTEDLALIARDLAVEMPVSHADWGAHALPLRQVLGGPTRVLTALLLSFVLVLFALACINVANLSLARITQRRLEIATRLALGATRRSIVARQAVEGALIGAGGGLVGMALCWLGTPPLMAMIPSAPRLLSSVKLDWRVAMFIAGLSVLTGVVIGIGPAVVGLRVAAESAFGGGRRESFGIRERRRHQGMMLAQVVAAAILLVSGGIVTTLRRLNHSATGLDSRGVVVARLRRYRKMHIRPWRFAICSLDACSISCARCPESPTSV